MPFLGISKLFLLVFFFPVFCSVPQHLLHFKLERVMLYGCQEGNLSAARMHPSSSVKNSSPFPANIYTLSPPKKQRYSFSKCTFPGMLMAELAGERFVFSRRCEHGFGLGFGGAPDLGFLPQDDYHLVAVITKKKIKNGGRE